MKKAQREWLLKHLDDPTLPVSEPKPKKRVRKKRPPTPEQLQKRQERKDRFRRRRQLKYTRARAARQRKGKRIWMRMIAYLDRQRILKERAEVNARYAEEQRLRAEAEANRKPTKAQRDKDAAFAEGFRQGYAAGLQLKAETTQL